MESNELKGTPSELWLATGHRYRAKSRLDYPLFLDDSPSVQAVMDALEGKVSPVVLIGGCEPTLRKDLPSLISKLAGITSGKLGIWTDGLALQSKAIVTGLKGMGLDVVRIPLHSGRSDAHDWIAAVSGASRRAAKAIRLCSEAGLEV